ncbi:HAD hydrolase, family IF [Raoultella terrigena]|uniref:HAD hydrolase, family IF n=1 Tax=Raoultella terrigena TaxID=577 RepID=A0A4U9CY81_RAOTE|nr:HAD hydrolase, family IF [Raoultella terrigena]
MNSAMRRVVFFDLDGTLHQQDMFGSFIRYVLRHQPLNLLPVALLLPVILGGLLVNGRAARWADEPAAVGLYLRAQRGEAQAP